MNEYRPRIVDRELTERLATTGAVVIEGPKSCGKTQTARQQAQSEVLLDLDSNAVQAAKTIPQTLLQGETPRLLDEWQIAPNLWNEVRREVDNRSKLGQFILTGSASPADDVNRHTGAGRFGFLQMRPMSLWESGVSTGEVSLSRLLEGEAQVAGASKVEIVDVVDWLVRGGWPIQIDQPVEVAHRAAKDYLKQVTTVDIESVAKIKKPQKLRRLIAALARNTAQDRSIAKLAAEVAGGGGVADRGTVERYLEALERLMIIEEQPAWGNHLRSKSKVIGRPRRHICCPSLAAAALNATPQKLLKDLNTLGFLFESLVVRDLRVYGQMSDATISHFRNNNGDEVDAIVETDDGRWGAFEVKLGTDDAVLDAAASKLLRFVSNVDTKQIKEPNVAAIITGSGYSYRRDDGVYVLSISTLGV